MTRHDDVQRLFVALHPPGSAARDLARRASARFPPSCRPTPVEQIHMTLQFIGDTPAWDLERVEESVRRSASGIGRFVLTPMSLVTMPKGDRPRLIAVITDEPPGLIEIHRRLATRLARNRRERAHDRFTPHITLCRFAGGPAAAVDEPIDVSGFLVDAISLVRSILHHDGAEHSEVIRVELDETG